MPNIQNVEDEYLDRNQAFFISQNGNVVDYIGESIEK